MCHRTAEHRKKHRIKHTDLPLPPYIPLIIRLFVMKIEAMSTDKVNSMK